MKKVDDDKPNPIESTLSAVGGTAPAPAHASGSVVAHYRLGDRLGQGGMGVVFRAVDQKLGRPVAIKFLGADRGDAQSRARFMREARAASALDHPNIGTVFEVGEAEGAPYLAMALYEGETLRERLRRGTIPVDEVVTIARQLCSALAAAHAAGIVHRDLKPANIMLLHDGTVKLLDFGLAKLTSIDESSLTRDGAILGTLAYIAPEQLKSANVDARADLWSLGALLYELLSGTPPFGIGPAATIVGRILSEEPPPLPSTTPPDLAAVTRALLRKNPAARLSSASMVGELLAQRVSPPVSKRGFLVGAAMVLAIAAAAGAWVLVPRSPAMSEDAIADAQTLYADAARDFDAKRYDRAAEKFTRVFEMTGESSILYNVAQAYRVGGKTEKAGFFFRKYLKTLPDDVSKATPEEREMMAAFEKLLAPGVGLVPSPSH